MYTKSSGVEKYSKGCANEAFCSKDNNRVCKAATESSECDREFEKKKGTAHSRKHNQVVLYQLKTQSRQWCVVIFLLNICLINSSVFRYVNT